MSVEAVQAILICVAEATVPVRPVGTEGVVVTVDAVAGVGVVDALDVAQPLHQQGLAEMKPVSASYLGELV